MAVVPEFGINQIMLLIVAGVTIISILPEDADKARNMLAGASVSTIILLFGYQETPHPEVLYQELIKWDVIVLIIFLTIFVDMLDELGYFEYIGIHLVKLTEGNQIFLFSSFGVMIFLMSGFLDNITAIILLSSLTITVCKRLEISPVPYIMYEAFLTGVGALFTPVGSVPNIILNSDAGIGFGQWVAAMVGFAILALAITTAYFLIVYRSFLTQKLSEEQKEELKFLDPNQVINSKRDVWMSTILIFTLIIGFILAEQVHIGIEFVAIALAVVTMFLTGIRSKEMWAKIDWNTLFFFSGLFVLVGSLDYTGALLPVSDFLGRLIVSNPNLLLFMIIFIGGIVSTVLNNIPISLLIASIFRRIVEGGGVVGNEFWYASVIATNVGASLTPIGSVVVIIAFEVLRKSDYDISILRYFKVTFPLFIVISLVGFFYLITLVSLGLI